MGREKRTSFTIIEIVIVVAIIAMISVPLVISFSTIGSHRLEAEARKIVANILWARQRTIATHQHHALNFDPVNRQYSIYKSPTGTVADFTTANLLKQAVAEASLALIQANLWIYSPQGDSLGVDDITLSDQGRSKRIRIFHDTGYVKIE